MLINRFRKSENVISEEPNARLVAQTTEKRNHFQKEVSEAQRSDLWIEAEAQFWLSCWENPKQDGWLARAYFSPNYKYFDQVLQRVKNKTTVLNLVFKEFLQRSIPTLISVLYAKGCHNFPLKNFCLTVPKNSVEEPFCVSESFGYRKILCLRGEYNDFI